MVVFSARMTHSSIKSKSKCNLPNGVSVDNNININETISVCFCRLHLSAIYQNAFNQILRVSSRSSLYSLFIKEMRCIIQHLWIFNSKWDFRIKMILVSIIQFSSTIHQRNSSNNLIYALQSFQCEEETEDLHLTH